jgi:regulator of protease activity HflC (stomatin/prohibitin superfamily)
MVLFVFAIIFFLVALVFFAVGKVSEPIGTRGADDMPKAVGYTVFAVCLLVSFVMIFFSSFTTVSTKNVGIVTAFGKPTGELSNGAHFVAPWETVHEMDAAVQPESFTQGPTSGDQDHRCIDVRLGNQSIGCAEARFTWQIQPSDARSLYQNFRSFDHLRNTLVLGALRSALNNVFQDYNPIVLLTTNATLKDVLNEKATSVQRLMRDEIGDRVNVSNVIIPLVLYDDATQANINAYQAQVGKTRTADQAIQTARKQAQANQILANSLKQTGIDVLISKCLDLVNEGKTPPGTCLPLTTGAGGNVLVQPGSSGAK